MKKYIRNINTVICKLKLASIKAMNQRLEVAKEKKRKREGIVKKRRAEVIVVKC